MLIANSCFCFFDYRGQVILRHKGWPPYRCFLPDLAGFKGSFCTGPGPLFVFTGGVPSLHPTCLTGEFPVYSEKYRENRTCWAFIRTLFPRKASSLAASLALRKVRTFLRTGN